MIRLYCRTDGIRIGNPVVEAVDVRVDRRRPEYQDDRGGPEKTVTNDFESDARFYRA